MQKLCDPARSTPDRVALSAMCQGRHATCYEAARRLRARGRRRSLLRLGLGGVPVGRVELDSGVDLLLYPGLGLFRLTGLFDL